MFALTVCVGMVPDAVGARLTVAVKVWSALDPFPSSAVTVIVAEPPATGVMVIFEPDALTVATPVAEEEGV